jgi:hypothetical protein
VKGGKRTRRHRQRDTSVNNCVPGRRAGLEISGQLEKSTRRGKCPSEIGKHRQVAAQQNESTSFNSISLGSIITRIISHGRATQAFVCVVAMVRTLRDIPISVTRHRRCHIYRECAAGQKVIALYTRQNFSSLSPRQFLLSAIQLPPCPRILFNLQRSPRALTINLSSTMP